MYCEVLCLLHRLFLIKAPAYKASKLTAKWLLATGAKSREVSRRWLNSCTVWGLVIAVIYANQYYYYLEGQILPAFLAITYQLEIYLKAICKLE